MNEDKIEGRSKAQFEASDYHCPFIGCAKCIQDRCTHFSRRQHSYYWEDYSPGAYFSDSATCHAGTEIKLWDIDMKKPLIMQKKKHKVGFWERINFGTEEVKRYDEKTIFKMLEEYKND